MPTAITIFKSTCVSARLGRELIALSAVVLLMMLPGTVKAVSYYGTYDLYVGAGNRAQEGHSPGAISVAGVNDWGSGGVAGASIDDERGVDSLLVQLDSSYQAYQQPIGHYPGVVTQSFARWSFELAMPQAYSITASLQIPDLPLNRVTSLATVRLEQQGTSVRPFDFRVDQFDESGTYSASGVLDSGTYSVFAFLRTGSSGNIPMGVVDLGSGQVSFTFSLAPVPLPPAVWLFGSALGLMGVMRRKIIA